MTRAGGGTTPGSGREEATRQRFWLSSGTFHEAGRLSGAIGGLTATGFGRERIAVVGQRPALDRFEAERRALLPAGPQGEADPDFFALLGDLVVAGLGGASEALYGTRGPLVQSLFPAPPGPRHAEAGQRWLGSDFATHWQARLATGAVILVASALDLIGQRLATRVLLAHCLDDIETHDFVL
ncbi:MAG: hypothetical protein R3D33_08630 [Hyphomicrobiaceae bacterium]